MRIMFEDGYDEIEVEERYGSIIVRIDNHVDGDPSGNIVRTQYFLTKPQARAIAAFLIDNTTEP